MHDFYRHCVGSNSREEGKAEKDSPSKLTTEPQRYLYVTGELFLMYLLNPQFWPAFSEILAQTRNLGPTKWCFLTSQTRKIGLVTRGVSQGLLARVQTSNSINSDTERWIFGFVLKDEFASVVTKRGLLRDKFVVLYQVMDEFDIPLTHFDYTEYGSRPKWLSTLTTDDYVVFARRSKKGLTCLYPGPEKAAKVRKTLGADEPRWIQLSL
ncbi:hypothetical protein C8J56DRAFT_1175235 [Mycena floridula]|nr:hypothetical protein C8J56DRAFT_1175235 [Mycena floridula]